MYRSATLRRCGAGTGGCSGQGSGADEVGGRCGRVNGRPKAIGVATARPPLVRCPPCRAISRARRQPHDVYDYPLAKGSMLLEGAGAVVVCLRVLLAGTFVLGAIGQGGAAEIWPVAAGWGDFAHSLFTTSWRESCPGNSCALGQAAGPTSSTRIAAKAPAAVARVVVGQWTRSFGTGTLVAVEEGRSLVVTCAHLFEPTPGASGPQIGVLFPDGQTFRGRLVAFDSTWDLALVELPPVGIAPIPVAERLPAVGQWLVSGGYGPDGQFVYNRGQLRGYVATSRTPTAEMLSLTGAARKGDSGGPVLDASGQLVGVLWGSDGQMVVASSCLRVRELLRRILGRGEQWPVPAGSQPPTLAPLPDSTPPPTPTVPPGSFQSQLAALADRVAKLERELGLAPPADGPPTTKLSDRLARLEEAAAVLPTLRQKVAEAEAAVGPGNLRAVVRDVALGLLAEQAPSLVDRLLPRLVEALGWTTPPSLAVVIAVRLIARLLARRAATLRKQLRRRPESPPPLPTATSG